MYFLIPILFTSLALALPLIPNPATQGPDFQLLVISTNSTVNGLYLSPAQANGASDSLYISATSDSPPHTFSIDDDNGELHYADPATAVSAVISPSNKLSKNLPLVTLEGGGEQKASRKFMWAGRFLQFEQNEYWFLCTVDNQYSPLVAHFPEPYHVTTACQQVKLQYTPVS